eukprot:TRINITY_DN6385_c0_g1_i2.p1 TRINITY_DN6385_c0_g1~~TRINITY_DN6385_c0_g1_i2.p1  ORF type:complete len:706 (-),score=154.62 TRINITY_DN6385_c0_g1_i2:96-2213(-)
MSSTSVSVSAKSDKKPTQRATYPPPSAYNSKRDVTPFDLKELFIPGELVNELGIPNSLQGTKLFDLDSVAQWARLIALTLVENNSRLKQIEAEKLLLSPNSQPKDPKRYSGGAGSNRDPRRKSQEKKVFVQSEEKAGQIRQIPRSVSADDIPKQQEGISVVPDVNRLSLERKSIQKPTLDGGRRLSQEQKNNQEQRRSQEVLQESKSDFRRLSQERKFERNNQEEARRSLELKDKEKEREPDQQQQQQQQSDPRRLSFERKGKQDPRRLSQEKKQYYNQEQRKSWRVHRNELADIIFDVYADLDQKFPIPNLRESGAVLNLLPLELRKFLAPETETPQNNPERAEPLSPKSGASPKTLERNPPRGPPNFDKQCSLLVYSWLIPHCKNLMYDPQFKSRFFEDSESAEEGEQHTQIFLDVLENRFRSGWSPSPKIQRLMRVSDKYKQYWFLVVYGGQLHEGEATKKAAQDYSDKILSMIEARALMGITGEPGNVSPSEPPKISGAPFHLPFVKPEIYPRDTSDPVALNRNAIWYRWESSLRKSKNDRRAEIVDILEREFPTLNVAHKDSFNLGNQLKAALELLRVKGDASVLVKLNEAQTILSENPHFLLIPEVIHEHAKIPLESDKSFGRLYYSARDCLLSELFHPLQHNFPLTTTTSSSSTQSPPIEKTEKTEKSDKQTIVPEKIHHIPPSKTLPSTPTNPPKKR